MLTDAPSETIILRPDQALREAKHPVDDHVSPSVQRVALSAGTPVDAPVSRHPARQAR
jgi:hypothetical protein